MIVNTTKPSRSITKSEGIITEKIAKTIRKTITIIRKNISKRLVIKSLIKDGFSSPYINRNPRLVAEIPLEDVQKREIAEKERNRGEDLKKTSSKILFAALKDASGKKERNTSIISYSDI